MLATAVVALASCTDAVAPKPPQDNSNPDVADLTVSTSTAVSISGTKVVTGKTYVPMTGAMAVGVTVYTDRTYKTMSPLPSVVLGSTYIRTANNDKVADPGSTSFLTFTVDRPVVVYVAHDNRLTVPKWLSSTFAKVGANIVNTDFYGKQYLALYKRSFPAGTVTLGSNVDKPANGNMYMVIVKPSTTLTTSSDKTAPVVTLTAPKTGATVTGSVTLTATATDNVGVAGVQFQLDGKALGSEDVSAPYAMTWSSKGVTNGSHTLSAVARDAAGNKSTSSVAVKVANLSTTTQPPPTTTTDSTTHGGYYVSPSGSSSGDGSSSNPWSITTAFAGASGKIHPGDTVWLRGGRYGSGESNSVYHATLSGTATAPIIIRQYPGERATINGNITADGNYVWFWGFEVANTNTAAQNVIGVDSHCPGCRFINLVVHDHSGDGFGMWSEGPNQVAYGNIVYNNGFHGSTSTTFGHGIYAQNNTGTKLLQDNILFDQFGYGIHVYGSDAAFLNNFTIDGNASFNSGLGTGMDYHIGGGSPVNNLVFTNNMSYRMADNRVNTVRLGYNWGPNNPGAKVTGNYLVGQLLLEHWNSLTFLNNTIIDPYGAAMTLEQNSGEPMTTGSWNDNTYVKTTSSYPVSPFQVAINGVTKTYLLSGWEQLTGFDGSSTVSSSMPGTSKVVVEPNAYEAGRANVLIYNWSHQGAVSVDLSQVLRSGDHYVIVNAQNFYGAPVTSGTYGGGSISIPITSVTPPTPITGKAPWTTGNEFNAYVVLKQ